MMDINKLVLEQKIINCHNNNDMIGITAIKNNLIEERSKLDFFLAQFIDTYGDKLEEKKKDKYNKFYSDKTEVYSVINHLLRVIDAYSK